MTKLLAGLLGLSVFLTGCFNQLPDQERTDDGLERVASRPEAGVYRNLDADFDQYKRLVIEPLTVEFVEQWRELHPEMSDAAVFRILNDAVKIFHEEFVEVMVDEGPFEIAQDFGPDVFVVVPRILNLDVPAPASEPGETSVTNRPVTMQMSGELRDSVTGALLLRVIMYNPDTQNGLWTARVSNRVNVAHDMRLSLGLWARVVREAIDVAKASKPR